MPPLHAPVMLSAVLFDLDNTLVDRQAAFRECVRARFSDPAIIEKLIHLDQGGAGDRDALFRYWKMRGGGAMHQAIFGRLISGRIHPDPGLLHELIRLSRKTKIGIITNGGGVTQRRKIRAAGLDAVFAERNIWISAEVGSAKPAMRVFQIALQSLNEPARHCLYIGDREDIDIRGAKVAGIRGRLVNEVLTGPRLRTLIQREIRR